MILHNILDILTTKHKNELFKNNLTYLKKFKFRSLLLISAGHIASCVSKLLEEIAKMLLAEHEEYQETNLTQIMNDYENDPHSIQLKPSPYYTLDLFSKLAKAKNIKNNNFTIMSWNCNSLTDKQPYLQGLLHTLHDQDENASFDIISMYKKLNYSPT